MPSPCPRQPRRRPWIKLLRVSLQRARKIAVVGIGSEWRGDDVAGLLVIRALRSALTRSQRFVVRLWEGGTAPENLTGEIRRFKPSHILLVDAADLGLKPGAVTLVEPDTIGNIPCSTHTLPLKILTGYLKASFPCDIMIIGIQPKHTDFGIAPSNEVKQTVKRVVGIIQNALSPLLNVCT